jgi:hypothetical protein
MTQYSTGRRRPRELTTGGRRSHQTNGTKRFASSRRSRVGGSLGRGQRRLPSDRDLSAPVKVKERRKVRMLQIRSHGARQEHGSNPFRFGPGAIRRRVEGPLAYDVPNQWEARLAPLRARGRAGGRDKNGRADTRKRTLRERPPDRPICHQSDIDLPPIRSRTELSSIWGSVMFRLDWLRQDWLKDRTVEEREHAEISQGCFKPAGIPHRCSGCDCECHSAAGPAALTISTAPE